jgi:hypothetical protein
VRGCGDHRANTTIIAAPVIFHAFACPQDFDEI